ncbi:MAG: hypothetical protein ACI4I7_00805 [Oscillospiraceae bacterium]
MHRTILKYFAVFIIGAVIYGCIEIAARGFTHITMGLLGGLSMIAIHVSNNGRREGMNYFVQLASITFFITAIEFISGEILNVMLGMNIWDYSDIPMNFDGQICLPFVGIWIILAAAGIALDDFLRWKMFGEDKNFRYLVMGKTKHESIAK